MTIDLKPATSDSHVPRLTHAISGWLASLTRTTPTPAYVYDLSLLRHAAARYQTLFPPNAVHYYALKANPQVALVRELHALGFGAEICSPTEYRLARQAGVPDANILVGGVAKSAAWLAGVGRRAHPAIVLDSAAEWERLGATGSDTPPQNLLLRLNPGAAFGTINMAGGAQFGMALETALDVVKAITRRSHHRFLGLHFYFGTQRLTVDPIDAMLDAVEDALHAFAGAGLPVKVVDLGLGLGIPYQVHAAGLDWAALRERLFTRWESALWQPITVWTEAGRALVAECGAFVARILETKTLHGTTFVTLDGGINVHNPGFGQFMRSSPRFEFVAAAAAATTQQVTVVGPLCTSADTLGRNIPAPDLTQGDFAIIHNAGAYCMTTGMWGFNSQPPLREAILERDTLRAITPQYAWLRTVPL